MKCRSHGPECSGPIITPFAFVRGDYRRDGPELCTYHGKLVVKLKTMTLAQLENLASKAIFKPNHGGPKHINEARRLALCSDTAGFHKNAEATYTGTYDYRNH